LQSFSWVDKVPTCNDFQGLKGCGQEVQWLPNPAKPGKKTKFNLDGTLHKCQAAATGISGVQQAQTHSNVERYMGKTVTAAVQEPLTDISKVLDNIDGKLSSINVNQIEQSDQLKKVLELKGNAPTLIDEIKALRNEVNGLSENIGKYRDEVQADLKKNAFVGGGELYKKQQEEEQFKLE